MWQVLPHLARQAGNAIRAAGGGKKGLDKVKKANPSWFKETGKRTTTKLDNRTGKPVSGSGAKRSAPKTSSAPKKGKAGFTEAQLVKYRAAYKDPKQWAKVPQNIKDKLIK
jgi:hypothetical protein